MQFVRDFLNNPDAVSDFVGVSLLLFVVSSVMRVALWVLVRLKRALKTKPLSPEATKLIEMMSKPEEWRKVDNDVRISTATYQNNSKVGIYLKKRWEFGPWNKIVILGGGDTYFGEDVLSRQEQRIVRRMYWKLRLAQVIICSDNLQQIFRNMLNGEQK